MSDAFPVRRLVGIGAIVASSLVLTACNWGWANFKRTDNLSVQHVPATSIQIDNANGAINVRTGVGDAVAIDATIKATTQERLDQVSILASRLQDGTLVLDAKWPGAGRKAPEGVSYEITLPDVANVQLTSSNGALSVEGAAGSVNLRTSNGPITVKRADGSVTLHTSNGRIDVEDAASSVQAQSSNGAVNVALRPTAAGPVTIKSSNGDVSLSFGPAFAGTLRGDTSNGLLALVAIDPAVVKDKGRTECTLEFPGSGISTIETSNGDLIISRTPG